MPEVVVAKLTRLDVNAGSWDFQELGPIFVGFDGFVKIAPADPTRWAVSIWVGTTGIHMLTTRPGGWSERGIHVEVYNRNIFTYAELGEWIQSDLYFITSDPAFNIGVVLINLRPRG